MRSSVYRLTLAVCRPLGVWYRSAQTRRTRRAMGLGALTGVATGPTAGFLGPAGRDSRGDNRGDQGESQLRSTSTRFSEDGTPTELPRSTCGTSGLGCALAALPATCDTSGDSCLGDCEGAEARRWATVADGRGAGPLTSTHGAACMRGTAATRGCGDGSSVDRERGMVIPRGVTGVACNRSGRGDANARAGEGTDTAVAGEAHGPSAVVSGTPSSPSAPSTGRVPIVASMVATGTVIGDSANRGFPRPRQVLVEGCARGWRPPRGSALSCASCARKRMEVEITAARLALGPSEARTSEASNQ